MSTLAIATALSLGALGQTSTGATGRNGLAIEWQQPSINAEDCASDAKSELLSLTVSNAGAFIPAGSSLFAWFSNSTSCTFDTKPTLIVDQVLNAGDPLVTTNDVLNFPADVDLLDPVDEFSSEVVIDEFDACREAGVEDGTHILCVGISTDTDSSISSSEPNGFVEFIIDTIAPPTPTSISVRELDGALEVTGAVESRSDDVATWIARIRPVDADEEDTPSCLDWDDTFDDMRENSGTGGETGRVEVEAKNGVLYQACLFTRDVAGNLSESSGFAFGTPVDECDFIECYPGELQTGFCGAGGGSAWTLLPVLWLLGSHRLRRKYR